MKKLLLIVLLSLVPFFALADDTEGALVESTALLDLAFDKINEQAETIDIMTIRIASLEGILLLADQALADSNVLLGRADTRIADDAIEITGLRNTIEDLITAGVEIRTYDWNILVVSGYPFNVGIGVAYNLPFLTSIGIYGGINHNIDSDLTSFQAGIKINLGLD